MTDSKKRSATPTTPQDDEALARDASELRALVARARRLIDRNAQALSDSQTAQADGIEDEETEEPMTVPIFTQGRATRSPEESPSADTDEQEHAIDALPDTFFTNTMGTLLLAQGRATDACVVFERVLLRDPNNEEARRGLERAIAAEESAPTRREKPTSHTLLRNRQSPVLRPARVEPKPAMPASQEKEPDGLLDRTDAPWGYDVDELRALPVDPNTIVVFWELRAQTLARATTSSGLGGTLALRVVSIRRSEDGSILRDERIERGVGRVGDWFVHGLDAGSTHQVSLGLEGRAGFLAILSTNPVSTARGAPSRTRAVVRARIALPTRTRVALAEMTRIAEVVGPAFIVQALVEERATRALRNATVISLPIRDNAAPPAVNAQSWTEHHAVFAVSTTPSVAGERSEINDFSPVEEEFLGTPRLSGHPSSARPSSAR